jgi:ATP-dependent Clp protease adapter protein ClpS
VCLLGAQEAFDRTREAHEYGLSLLTVTHREHAELLQEQLAEFGLEVTIEPES